MNLKRNVQQDNEIKNWLNQIICGDNVEVMRQMPDKCIDLTVTSPPYDNLRTYNGFSFNFEEVAQELYRITKDGGVVVWVVGDETKRFCESLTSFKQAMFFVEDCRFNLLDTMIYYKQNYAPAYPNLKRYANQFEYMFVFSKGRPNAFNPLRVPKIENRNGMSGFRQRDGSIKRKKITTEGDTKEASNVWSYAVGFKSLGHPAPFPEQLAKDHIISWSNPGDLVFDPFLGSGTTAKMALLTGRNYLGCDISEEYCEIARRRVEQAQAQ